MLDEGIHVFVTRRITTTAGIALPDASCSVDKDLIKPPPVGLIGILVTQMPLPKNAVSVACGLQNLGNGHGLEAHALPFNDGVGHAILEFMTAGKQGTAGRCASRADMKIVEADTLAVQSVEVGRLQDGIPVG